MIPEFPRAPIRAARETVLARVAGGDGTASSSAATTAATVRERFVPVSPSGTG
jgi:hypothetical protein